MMLLSETVMLILAGGIALSGIAILSRMRLYSMVSVFRFQSVLLALLAFLIGFTTSHFETTAVALLILVVKGAVIPWFLTSIRRSVHATERLQSYVRPTPATLLGIAAIAGAAYAAHVIAPDGSAYIFATVAFSLMLFGLILLLARTDMYGQAIGFLVLENGLFTFGLTLTHGIPLFIEIGILFDVLIVFVLIFALIRRAHIEHASTSTDRLHELVG